MAVDFIFLKLPECFFPPKGLLGAAIAIDVTFILSSATSGGASSLPLPSLPQRSTCWPAAHTARVGLRGPGRGQRTESLLPPLLLGAHLGWCPHRTLLSPDPAHCSCACAPGPGTRDPVWPKPGFALTCSKPPFCPVLWDEPRGGGGTVCFLMFCLVSPQKDSENLHRDRQSPQWPIPFREKGSLGRCTGLGNKGCWETSWDRQGPISPHSPRPPGCHPHASSLPGCTVVSWCWKSPPSLRPHRPGSAVLGQMCAWLPRRAYCPLWGSVGCHQQGPTAGAPWVNGLSCTSLSA